MSKVKIEGHGTGTGTFTVTTPSSNTDRTITLPDSTGTLATTADVPAGITSSADVTAMTITSDEDIGVGTASPSSRLHVYDGAGANIAIQSSAGSHWRIGDAVGASNGQLVIRDHTNSANRITILADGKVQTAQGILFGSDTAAANTLDDYEYGEFDASFSSSGASFSYTARKGYYTKIGNRVFYNIYMQLDGSQTFTSNQVTITGLPFTSNGGGHFNSSAICETRYVDFDSGFTALAGRIGANTTSILLLEIGDGQAGNVLRSDQLSSSSGQVFINGSYAI